MKETGLWIALFSVLGVWNLQTNNKANAFETASLSGLDTVRIPYETLDFSCFEVDEGTYIINSQSELQAVFSKRNWKEECENIPLAEVDFEKYTILGFVRGSSGCSRSKLRMAIRKNKSKKEITLSGRIKYTGDCMMYVYYIRWCLIEKIPEDYQVKFYLF